MIHPYDSEWDMRVIKLFGIGLTGLLLLSTPQSLFELAEIRSSGDLPTGSETQHPLRGIPFMIFFFRYFFYVVSYQDSTSYIEF